jgi:peptidoglycan DL-endopeptidase CwlO
VTHGRKRLITALSGFALAATIGFIPSAPAQAEPDIDDVQAKVDRLYHEAEQASERYNDARIELSRLHEDLESLQSDQSRQGDQVESVRSDLRNAIIRQYQGQNLSASGQMLLSEDSSEFLSQISTMSAVGHLQDRVFDDFANELEALDIRSDATQKRVDQVSELKEQLADEKSTIDDKLAEAESLLDRLKEKEREAILSRGTDRLPSDVPASGRAGAAIKYAMSKVGGPYSYGGAGPTAFDCSGLTMMAWAQAGVALPHSSSAQFSSGPRVAESDLKPGDLVFYYSPISHVGMYIGNGMIVHAANPGAGIRVSGLHTMPYVGAVRPG